MTSIHEEKMRLHSFSSSASAEADRQGHGFGDIHVSGHATVHLGDNVRSVDSERAKAFEKQIKDSQRKGQ